jgi:hypothetical protein
MYRMITTTFGFLGTKKLFLFIQDEFVAFCLADLELVHLLSSWHISVIKCLISLLNKDLFFLQKKMFPFESHFYFWALLLSMVDWIFRSLIIFVNKCFGKLTLKIHRVKNFLNEVYIILTSWGGTWGEGNFGIVRIIYICRLCLSGCFYWCYKAKSLNILHNRGSRIVSFFAFSIQNNGICTEMSCCGRKNRTSPKLGANFFISEWECIGCI